MFASPFLNDLHRTLCEGTASGMEPTLDAIRDDIAARLATAATDRTSPMHTPVVGTQDAGLRVMVLRAFDAADWSCRFNTDARAPKVATIRSGEEFGAKLGLLFYDAAAKLQIRATGHGRVESHGPHADAAWDEATPFARRCYLAQGAPGEVLAQPGSGLPSEVEGVKPSEAQLAPARANFAVLLVRLQTLDWLYLDHAGHRRAQFDLIRGHARFVVP